MNYKLNTKEMDWIMRDARELGCSPHIIIREIINNHYEAKELKNEKRVHTLRQNDVRNK